MTDFNQNIDGAKDLLNLEQKDMNRLPSMLNVLTILTYIGCGVYAISAIWNYFSIGWSHNLYQEKAIKDLNSENKVFNSLMSGAEEMMKKQYDNRLYILLLSLLGILLCFYGAVQMRKLKKQGYLVYVVGEILPIISFAVLIGFSNWLLAISMLMYILIAAAFIILYTTQRKELVN